MGRADSSDSLCRHHCRVGRRGVAGSDGVVCVEALFRTVVFFPGEARAHRPIYRRIYLCTCLFASDERRGRRVGICCFLWCVISFLPTTGSHSSHEEILRAAWMANPCFWAAVAFLSEGRRWLSCICALLAAGLALTVHDSSPGGFAVYN